MGRLVLRIVAGLVLLYLFMPIFVIVLFSFNNPKGKFNYSVAGFHAEELARPVQVPGAYGRVEAEPQHRSSLHRNRAGSRHIGGHRTCPATVPGPEAVDTFLVLPLTAPEVVMGASLLVLFLDLGWAAGYTTILLAHIAFEVSFIAMTVRARVRGFDWTLEDASMDLGASPTRTFFKVTLPLIVPGIIAAAMLSFALSLDDFIITYFVSGSSVTYPLYVNASVKAAVPPQINVLATAILVISLILLSVGTLLRRRQSRAEPLGVESHRHRDAATLISIGDRMPIAIPPVQIQQGDRSAVAEEVAPPVLCVWRADVNGHRVARSAITHRDYECLARATADVANHHQSAADHSPDERGVD